MKTAIHIVMVMILAAVIGAFVAIAIAPTRIDSNPTAAIAEE